jgi:hypothetical protein
LTTPKKKIIEFYFLQHRYLFVDSVDIFNAISREQLDVVQADHSGAPPTPHCHLLLCRRIKREAGI